MEPHKTLIKRLAEAATSDSDRGERATPAKVAKFLSQEANIIQCLFGENTSKRMHQVRQLPAWFTLLGKSSYPYAEEDFMRIWKGLLHTIRMSEKPQDREELVEQAAQMVDSFGGNTTLSLAYFSAFMRTTSEEHSGVKLKRLDKWVLMLVRRMLRHVLRVFKRTKWSAELIGAFNKSMQKSVFSEKPKSHGLIVHYLSIFFEELAKEANGDITAAQVSTFLLPFVKYMATQKDGQLLNQCRAKVLYYLLYQSDLGRKSLKKKIISPDPLVGKVDWKLSVLPVNPDYVLDELNNLLSTSKFNPRRRKSLCNLIQLYETYKSGKFPFAVCNIEKEETTINKIDKKPINSGDVALEQEISVSSLKPERKKLLQKSIKSCDPQLATPQPVESGKWMGILFPEQQQVKLKQTNVPSSINNEGKLINEQAAGKQTADVKPKAKENTHETPMIVQQSAPLEHGKQKDLAPWPQQELEMAENQQFAFPQPVGGGEQVRIMSPEQKMEVKQIGNEVEIVHELAADKPKADDKPQAKQDEQFHVNKEQQTKAPNEKQSVLNISEQAKQLKTSEQPNTMAAKAEIKPETSTKTAGLPEKDIPETSKHGKKGTFAISLKELQLIRKYNLVNTANWLDRHFATPSLLGSGEGVEIISPEQQQLTLDARIRSGTKNEVEEVNELNAGERNKDGEPKAKKAKEAEQLNVKNPEQPKSKNPQPLHARKQLQTKAQEKEQQPNQSKKNNQPKLTAPPKATQNAANSGGASSRQRSLRDNAVSSQQKKLLQKRSYSKINNAGSCVVKEVKKQPMQPKTTEPEPQRRTAVLPDKEQTNKSALFLFGCSCL